jgi:hypothetical protein
VLRAKITLGALCAAALLSCSKPEVTRVELTPLAFDYGFLVMLDSLGKPTRVSTSFGYSDGELRFGTLPVIELQDAEHSFVLVTLRRERFEELGLLPERPQQLEVQKAPPPEVPKPRHRDHESTLLLAVPADAGLYFGEVREGMITFVEREETRAEITANITLEIPIDPEYCRIPDQSSLDLLGPDPYVMQEFSIEEQSVAHFDQLEWLDEQRFLALTWMDMVVIEAGAPVVPGPHALRLLEEQPTAQEGLRLVRFAIDPRTRDSSVLRILVVGAELKEKYSKVWELELRDGALSLLTETSTAGEMTDVVILEDGSEWFGLRGGVLLKRDAATGELHDIPLEVFEGDVGWTRLLALDDAELPLLVTTQTRAHLYHRDIDRFLHEILLQEGAAAGDPIDFGALAVDRSSDGKLDIWLGGERGALFRYLGGVGWRRVTLNYPPRILNCGAREDSGEYVYPGRFSGAAISRDYVHLILTDCNAILQVRRSDQCVSLVTRGDVELMPVQQKTKSVAAREGSLVAGTLGNQIFRSVW